MPKKYLLFCLLLETLIFSPGCEAWLVMTSRYHEPKTETPESITRFTKKSHIDGYPILRYETSYFPSADLWGNAFPVYNSEGHFLSLRDTIPGCPDKKQNYVAMKYILEHGDEHFIRDTLINHIASTGDSVEVAKRIAYHGMNRPQIDSSLWEFHVEKYCTHLNQFAPYLRSLDGEKVNIDSMYADYLVVNEFQLYGRPSLQNYLIKEKLKDIKKLNKEFGNRIQFVLINLDRMQ